ncbi:MAG: (d)CMP kinase [Candidatus Omnitrophota bacterium]
MGSTKGPSTSEPVVITIDGPAGAGKSTIARALARQLKYTYLDTGAMYRALTLKALEEKIDLNSEKELIDLAHHTLINIEADEHQNLRVLLDGKDVTEDIRSLEVTNNTYHIAQVPGVREVMVQRQREIGRRTNVVIEGRDVGTMVFPKATKKFYLDADFKERAVRRIKELKDKGMKVDEQETSHNLKERDTKDMTRDVGPLKKAEDAIVIDSTHLSIEEVVNKIMQYIDE